MNVDSKHSQFKRYSIYFTYKSEGSVDKALSKLRFVFPKISFHEVDAWFSRFRNKNFDLSKDIVLAENPKTILDLPAVPIKLIIDMGSSEDLKNLRCVNRMLYNLVNAKDRIINKIVIHLSLTVVLIRYFQFGASKEIRVSEYGGGCTVIENGERTVHTTNFVIEGANQFRKLIEKFYTKLTKFEIRYDKRRENEISEMREMLNVQISTHLEAIMNRLHVEKLLIEVGHMDQVLSLLRNIQVGPLTWIEIECVKRPGRVNHIRDILNSPHWPNLNQIRIRGPSDLLISDFFHKERVSSVIPTITPEEVINYKNMLLDSDSPKIHSFVTLGLDTDELRLLIPDHQFTDFDRDYAVFNMANGFELQLQIHPVLLFNVTEV